jgi:hypothetical protein
MDGIWLKYGGFMAGMLLEYGWNIGDI